MEHSVSNNFIVSSYMDVRGVGRGRCDFCPNRSGTVVMVTVVELLNTGIESAIDRIGPEWHALAKRAKDMGSAAVLRSLLLRVGVWAAALYAQVLSFTSAAAWAAKPAVFY